MTTQGRRDIFNTNDVIIYQQVLVKHVFNLFHEPEQLLSFWTTTEVRIELLFPCQLTLNNREYSSIILINALFVGYYYTTKWIIF